MAPEAPRDHGDRSRDDGADADLREAAVTLFENKLGCLPVVEGTRLVGILTEADFIRYFIERSS